MKKIFTMLFAAAAVLAGCSKMDEQKVDPSTPSETSFFYGSIEQPSDPTRTTLDDSNGVQWEVEDMIVAYRLGTSVFKDTTAKMAFHAEKAGCESFFSAKNISAATKFHKTFDSFGYDVYFGTDNDSIPCIPSNMASYESGSVRHLPMYAKVAAGVYGPGQREAVFNNVCAVLKVDVSGSLFTMNKLVVTATGDDKIAGKYRMTDSGVEFLDGASTSVTYGCAASNADKVFYIPVKPGEHKLTFTAYEDETVLGEMDMKAAAEMNANTIYPITFVNLEYTISASTTSPFTLPSSTGFVKITAAENISNPLEFTYGGDNHPANVVIDAGGHTISALTITLPDSHVELQNGSSVTVVSQTSATTLDVTSTYTISESVTLNQGNLIVNGNVKEAIVSDKVDAPITIAIGEGSEAKLETVTNNSSVLTTIDVPQGKDIPEKKGEGPFESPVASIGTKSYSSLKAAADVANEYVEAVTITMIDNTALTELVEFTNSTNMVTLDLNGKTITINGDNTAEPKVANRISVNGGQLTITDGSSTEVASQGSIIAADGTKGTSNVVAIGGTLVIDGGNIISDPGTDDVDAAVYGKEGATVTVNGGYIRGEGNEGALSVNSSTDDIAAEKVCRLTIAGGELEYSAGKNSTLYIYRSNATISGGHILNSYTESTGGAAITANNENNTTVQVSVNVSDNANIESKAQYGLRARYGMPVNISGGRISGRKPFTASGAQHTVSGGEIYNDRYGWDVLTVADGATITVTGGKLYATTTTNLTSVSGTSSNVEFSGSVISNKAFLNNRVKDGWVIDRNVDAENPEYVFKLVEAENSITAEVTGGTYHCTPAGARQYVNSSTSPVTLTVERDCQAPKIFFEKGREGLITLDLNGHIITNADNDQEYIIRTNSNLVVTDSTNTTGAIEAPHCAIRVDSSAVLTIDGGSFSGDGLTEVGCGVLYSTGTAEALNINGGTITCTGKNGRAVNIGSDGQMTGGSITSDGSCLRTYISGKKFYVTGANVKIHNTTNSEVAALLSSNGTIYAQNGYYYIEGTALNPFQNHATRVYVTGGKMNVRDTLVKPASGYTVSELPQPETVEGKTYSYQVTLAAAPKASVNGVDYASIKLAMDAAINYTGDCDTVLIVLKDSVDQYKTRTFLTNTASKPICLDLNGNTFTVAQDSIFTSENRLRIKDSGTPKGKFITSGNRLFFFNTFKEGWNNKGPLYLDGCIIESSDEGSSNSTPAGSVISLYGKKGAVPELYMLNGAKIIKSKKGLGVFQRYSNVHIDNSTIELNSDDNTDYGIYMYATTTLNLKAGSSIYVKSGHSVRSGSQYASINVYDEAYMWGGVKCISASAAGSLTNKIKIYGGYFSQDIAGDKAASGSIYTNIVVNGDQTSGTWTKDGVTYNYHITPKN